MEKEVLIIGVSILSQNSDSIIEYIVTPIGERFACLKRN